MSVYLLRNLPRPSTGEGTLAVAVLRSGVRNREEGVRPGASQTRNFTKRGAMLTFVLF